MALLLALLGLAFACTGGPGGSDERAADTADKGDTGAPVATESARDRYLEIYRDENAWPVRLWLEEPLVGDDGQVQVPPQRLGVLMYLKQDGDARIDFGRYGAHTVPASQTNLASEVARVRSGEATKTHPNLFGMVATRLVDPSSPELALAEPPRDGLADARVLLVFADPFGEDVAELQRMASSLADDPSVRLVALMPLTEQADAPVHAELRAQGWTEPFVITSAARSYAGAMLEPGIEGPWLRLCTSNGRILAEGPPSPDTLVDLRAALTAAGG